MYDRSAEGDTDFLGGKDAGDKEAALLLVVVADGVEPVLLPLLALVHLGQQPASVVHRLALLHLAHLQVQTL